MSSDSSMVRCSAILVPVSRLGFGSNGFQERSPYPREDGKTLDTSTPYLYNRELGLMSLDYNKEEIGQWFEVEPYWKDVNPNIPRPLTGAIHATIERKVTQKVEVEALVTNKQRYNYYNGIAIALYVEDNFMTIWNDHLGIVIHFGRNLYDTFSPLQPVTFKAIPVCEHRFSAFTAVKVVAAKMVKLSHLCFGKHAQVQILQNGFVVAKCKNGDQVFLLDEARSPMSADSVEEGMLVNVAYYRIQLHDGPIFISAYATNHFDYFDEPFEILCNGRKINDELFSEYATSSSSAPRRSPQELKELLDANFNFFDIDNTDMQWMIDRAHIEIAESVTASRVSTDDSLEDEREDMARRRQLERMVNDAAAEEEVQEVVYFPQEDSSGSEKEEEEAPPAVHTAVSESGTFIISRQEKMENTIDDDDDDDSIGTIPDIDLNIESNEGVTPVRIVYPTDKEFRTKYYDEDDLIRPKPRQEIKSEDKENLVGKVPVPSEPTAAPLEKPMTRLSNPLQNNAVEGVAWGVTPTDPKEREALIEKAREIIWKSHCDSLKENSFEESAGEFLNTKEAEILSVSTPLSVVPSRVHPGLLSSCPSSLGAPAPMMNNVARESPVNREIVRESPVKWEPLRVSPVKKEPVRVSPVVNQLARESPVKNHVARESPVANRPVESPAKSSHVMESPRTSPEMTTYHSAKGSPYSIASISPSDSPSAPAKKTPSPNGQPLGRGGIIPSIMRDMIRVKTTPSPHSAGRPSPAPPGSAPAPVPPAASSSPAAPGARTSRLSTSSSSTNGEALRRVRNDSGSSSATAGKTLKFGPKKDGESYEAYLDRTMQQMDSQESRLIRLALNEIYTSAKMRDIVKKYFPGILPVIKRLFENPTEVNLSILDRFQMGERFESSDSAYIDRITLENQVYRLVQTTSAQMWRELVNHMTMLKDINFV